MAGAVGLQATIHRAIAMAFGLRVSNLRGRYGMITFLLACSLVAFQDNATDRPIYESLSMDKHARFTVTLMSLLHDQNIQKELEILPSQIDEIKQGVEQSKTDYNTVVEAAMKENNNSLNSYGTPEVVNARKKLASEYNSVLSNVLLPHQKEKLTQTVVWTIVREHRLPSRLLMDPDFPKPGFQSVLHNEVVRELLGIDERQAEKIQERTGELQAEYAKEMAALHERFEKRLREELTAEQRKKAEQIVGETPEFLFSPLKDDN